MPSVADRLVAAHAPWWTRDLEDFLRVAGSMFAQVERYAADSDDGTPGWTSLFAYDTCPTEALSFLGQFVGELLPIGISEVDARQWIKDAPNYQRGTVRSIARAAQRTLVGNKTVEIVERILPDGSADPDGDHFTVYTYTDETPYPDRVRADLEDVIPDDMLCNYQVVAGATWAGVQSGGPSWTTIEGEYPTWDKVRGATPGASVWTRE